MEDSNCFLMRQCLGYSLDRPASECFRSFVLLRFGVGFGALKAQNPIVKAVCTQLVCNKDGDPGLGDLGAIVVLVVC